MSFYVYLLKLSDERYYVGHTDNLDSRIAQHQAGLYPGFTQTRRPVALLWSEYFQTRDEALDVEQQLKGWSRAKRKPWSLAVGLRSAPLRANPSIRAFDKLSPYSGRTE